MIACNCGRDAPRAAGLPQVRSNLPSCSNFTRKNTEVQAVGHVLSPSTSSGQALRDCISAPILSQLLRAGLLHDVALRLESNAATCVSLPEMTRQAMQYGAGNLAEGFPTFLPQQRSNRLRGRPLLAM